MTQSLFIFARGYALELFEGVEKIVGRAKSRAEARLGHREALREQSLGVPRFQHRKPLGEALSRHPSEQLAEVAGGEAREPRHIAERRALSEVRFHIGYRLLYRAEPLVAV